MSARPPFLHLSDTEIDDYWKGALTPEEEERVEQHYLDCNDCAARVQVVEDLLNLRERPEAPARPVTSRVRQWQAAAAILAALAVLSVWQWASVSRRSREPAALAPQLSDIVAVVQLAPPTRDSQLHELTLPAAGVVMFELDAREAGAPGSRFDLSLNDDTNRVIVRLSNVTSTATGLVRVPLDRSLLGAGRYAFELSLGTTAAGFPFLIRN